MKFYINISEHTLHNTNKHPAIKDNIKYTTIFNPPSLSFKNSKFPNKFITKGLFNKNDIIITIIAGLIKDVQVSIILFFSVLFERNNLVYL